MGCVVLPRCDVRIHIFLNIKLSGFLFELIVGLEPTISLFLIGVTFYLNYMSDSSPSGARTHDNCCIRTALYQLSYRTFSENGC